MSSFNPIYIIPFAVLLFVAAVIVIGTARRVIRARTRARRRVIEMPNSHYTSQLVRNHETRHRWHNIALDRIHEVNRGEVERLLARVEATGVDSLRPAERVFLDQVAQFAPPQPAAGPRDKGRQVAPDLRHRPA